MGTESSELAIAESMNAGTPRHIVVLIVTLLVVGGFLRFYALDAQSLWNDELSTWAQSHQESIADVIEKGVRPTPSPPGFQILIYYVERFIGESEIALRLPSAVAGVFAIVAMFSLAQRVYSRR